MISSKLPHLQTSIFSKMSALATAQAALNLSQGFPDFEIDPILSNMVYKHMQEGKNQYAPMPGILPLREQIAEKIHQLYQNAVDPSTEITITAGATQALYTAISCLVKTGDEVLLFTPCYDSYVPAIQINGGLPIEIPLDLHKNCINWDVVHQNVNAKTRLILINSPHNPTGQILTQHDIDHLVKLTHEYPNLLILSDEVYEHIIFDERQHLSILKYPQLYQRSMVVFSFGKTFHATGWKIGYIVAPEAFSTEFRKLHSYTVFSCNTPIQYALAEYMQTKANYPNIALMYQAKRNLFIRHIQHPKLSIIPSSGTYFQLIDYSAYSQESDEALAIALTINHKIASIPLSPFFTQHQNTSKKLRFCFAKKDETLLEAARILNTL